MASPVLPVCRFVTTEGWTLPSVRRATCRDHAVAHLQQRNQKKEEDYEFRVTLKDEEIRKQKEKVKELEETILRIQEENQHLVQELKKCQEQLRAKDEVDLQASQLQKVESVYSAETRIQNLEESLKSLTDGHLKIVRLALDMECRLRDSEHQNKTKEEKFQKLQHEVSKLQEQRNMYYWKSVEADHKIHSLEENMKALVDSFTRTSTLALNTQHRLQDSEQRNEMKDEKIQKLHLEVSKLQEQGKMYYWKSVEAGHKIHSLEENMKALEDSYLKMVKFAVDSELERQDCEEANYT